MHKTFILLAFALIGARTVVASQETDVMAPVRQFVDGFNKSDLKMAQSACADRSLIIDDFPPHAWAGAGATAKWLHDYDSYAKRNGITEGTVTLGKPRHIDVTGNDAYVVVPTEFSLKKKGEPVKETGLMTLVLHKEGGGWRIAAWSWADN
jgi:ketosteroid isomerase-like protein